MKSKLLLFLIVFLSQPVHADHAAELPSADLKTLIVENIWIREAPPNVNVLAAYMTLKNPTDQDITLVCAESPAFKDIMFHKTEVSNGIAKMRHADEIVIPAHSDFILSPGNYHMMLMGRKVLLKEGDNVKLTLIFKTIENQKITAIVKKSVAE